MTDPSTGSGTGASGDPGSGASGDPGSGASGDPDSGAADRDPAAAELVEEFPPTLREVMLRPRWIGMLLLCLVVAGVFAWLGQWQLGRALQTNPVPPGATEEVQPIGDVAGPGEYLPEPLVGQRVETTGTWVPGDFLIVSSRFNEGVEGYWVTGQLRLRPDQTETDGPVSVAVALGWAVTEDDARAAVDRLEEEASGAEPVDVMGRLISDEGPVPPSPREDPQSMTRMSPAALLGQWHDVAGLSVYRPYLASSEAFGGLEPISSPAPGEGPGLNWLNIFYAVEWAVFAGFAFYLWYRLARDAWEKEIEDFEDAAAEGAAQP